MKRQISRRDFLKTGLLVMGGAVIASCTPALQTNPAPTEIPATVPPKPEATTPPTVAPTAVPPTAVPPTLAPSDATYKEWISTVASTDPVEVRIVHWFDPNNPSEHNQSLMDYATAEWKKRYPNGKINWELIGWGEIDQKTPAMEMANDPVDISYNWGAATANWCKAGFVVPLDGLMPKWWVDTRVPAILKPPANDLCPDGKLGMAALGIENQGVIIRKDIMKETGVDPDSMGTYDGFLAGLKKMSAKKGFEKPYAFKLGQDYATMDSISFYWLSNGLTFGDFREDGSEKDAWIQAATFVKGLMDLSPEACLNWGWAEVEQAYATGQIAAMDHGMWYYTSGMTLDTSGKIINPDNTGVVGYPYGPASPVQQAFVSFSLTGFFLLKTSLQKNRQGAIDLISILNETRTVWKHQDGTVPPTTDWTTEDRLKAAYDPTIGWWWQEWEDLKKKSNLISYQGFLARDEITGAAFPLMVSMFRNEITPEQLYTKVRETALPLIQAAKGS